MRWAIEVLHSRVVLTALIRVSDDEADGAPCGLSLEDSTEQLYLVGLVALRGDFALTGTPSLQFVLDKSGVDVDAGGHSVDYATHCFSMTLSEGRQTEDVAESV